MSKFFAFFALLLVALGCLAVVNAAPVEILDAQTAIQKIIAEYEKLPGTSIHHPPEVATLIDPNNFHINL